MNNSNMGVNWGALILGILFLLGSFYAFMNPATSVQAASVFLSIMIIVYGVAEIVSFFRLRQLDEAGCLIWFDLIAGIFGIAAGVYLMANPMLATTIMTILFSVWFLFIFIRSFFTLRVIRQFSTLLFWISLVINILGVIVGVLLIFNPLSAFITFSQLIALGLLFGGVTLVINAFA